MYEDDYRYLQRIEEYAKRRWKEPLVCSYLWDKYGLETHVVNRKEQLCRIDVDYAYDTDFNLNILVELKPQTPLLYGSMWINAEVYDDMGDLETGHLVLYSNHDTKSTKFKYLGKLPYILKIDKLEDFKLVVKYYTSDETTYAGEIDVNDEVNLSDVIDVHVKDYTESRYFVSSSGNDNNDGTIDKPFSTLQHASDVIDINDTICCLTNLDLPESVSFKTPCYLIGKEQHTVLSSKNKEYLTILGGAKLYIQNIDFDSVYSYNNGAYIQNEGTAKVYVKSSEVK